MLGRILHSPVAVREARAVPESDDEELLPGLQRRDPHSIAKLYDLYGSQVYRLILDKVECRCIADDLVVQTFLLAWNPRRATKLSAQLPCSSGSSPWRQPVPPITCGNMAHEALPFDDRQRLKVKGALLRRHRLSGI